MGSNEISMTDYVNRLGSALKLLSAFGSSRCSDHLQKHRKPWRTVNLAPRDWRFPTGAVCKKKNKCWSKCKNESSNKALPTQSPTQKSLTRASHGELKCWHVRLSLFPTYFHQMRPLNGKRLPLNSNNRVKVAARVSSTMCHIMDCAPTL